MITLISITFLTGVDNLLDDIEFMVGSRPSFYWRFCWYYLTPLTLLSILIYFLSELTPIRYNGEYYPTSAYGTTNSTRHNILDANIFLFYVDRNSEYRCSIRVLSEERCTKWLWILSFNKLSLHRKIFIFRTYSAVNSYRLEHKIFDIISSIFKKKKTLIMLGYVKWYCFCKG